MNDQNRVLARQGARPLNDEEIMQVNGGLQTETKCSCCINGKIDGDPGECGAVW
jgi:hypothetical protein